MLWNMCLHTEGVFLCLIALFLDAWNQMADPIYEELIVNVNNMQTGL